MDSRKKLWIDPALTAASTSLQDVLYGHETKKKKKKAISSLLAAAGFPQSTTKTRRLGEARIKGQDY